MKFKPNYVIIPLITIAVALLGSAFTMMGMDWYNNELILPAITPPRWAFPVAWNTIFLLTTISALIIWNKGGKGERHLLFFTRRYKGFWWMIGLYIANAVLNVLWSLLFFTFQLVFLALIEMILLQLTLIFLIPLTYTISKKASLFLIPYLLWVAYATYLTNLIYTINF